MPRVNIDLVARTAKLQKGLDQANKRLSRFARRGTQITSVFRKAFAAAAAYASVRALGAVVKNTLSAIDSTAKLSDRIGESTENIIRLQHAATITGAGAGKLAAGIDVLQKRLGEAAMGMGEGKAALDSLGLSVDAILKMSPAEQFKTIADATSQLSTKAEQAAVTAKLFSRANQDLVNTLALGRDGLEEMGREADELGATFSRDTAKKVEEANDEITRMKAAWGGVVNQITIALAPAIRQLAERLVSLTKTIQVAGEAWDEWLGTAEAPDLSLHEEWIRGLQRQMQDGIITVNEYTEALARWDRLREKMAKRSRDQGGDFISGLPAGFTQTGQGLAGIRAAAGTSALDGLFQQEGMGLAGIFSSEAQMEKVRKNAEERIALEQRVADETIRQHQRAMQAAKREADARQNAVSGIAGALVQLTAVGASESRKQFETSKKFALGAAVVNTSLAVVKALSDTSIDSFWTRRANAVAAGIAGAAQIAAISSTSFGGGSAAAPPPAVADVGGGGGGPSQIVNITLEGSSFSASSIDNLIEQVNDRVGDGVTLNATRVA